ncbi:MAG: dihydroneopterin triphosphate 2'-epimerase [Marinifilaceae bacterium]
MAVIRIKNLLLRTYIGFNPIEKKDKQDVLINMRIRVNVERAIHQDDVNGSYNYKTVTKQVIRLVQEGRFNMLEHLTQKILDTIMEDERVEYARVEVDKPHALRFAESVSVELETSRNE